MKLAHLGAPADGVDVLLNMPARAYFDNAGMERPALSQTVAKVLLEHSPAHARAMHPRLGHRAQEQTTAQAAGALLDALLLGGAEIVEIEHDSYRTKAARAARDAATDEGKLPALSDELNIARRQARLVRAQCDRAGIRLDGDSQVTIRRTRDTLNGPISVHARLDHVEVDTTGITIYDLKRTTSASTAALQRTIDRYRYDIQAAAYLESVLAAYPRMTFRVWFKFLFVEVAADGAVAVRAVSMDNLWLERGRRHWDDACNIWAGCLKTDNWPGYVHGELPTPSWIEYKEKMEHGF